MEKSIDEGHIKIIVSQTNYTVDEAKKKLNLLRVK